MPRQPIPLDIARVVAVARGSTRQVAAQYGVSHSAVANLRRKAAAGELPAAPGPELNAYTAPIDALDFLESIPTGAVSAVVTSPPYNRRRRIDGRNPSGSHSYKRELMLSGFDGFADSMPWPEYIEQQRMMLAAAMRLVGGNDGEGAVLYQYQLGIEDGVEHFPEGKILDGFRVRQRIIWQVPGSGGPVGPESLYRNIRIIALITGRHWRVPHRYRNDKHIKDGSVWRIQSDQSMEHPAAFPLELAVAMCKLAPSGGAVADPYAGGGTVGLAAVELGKGFYLGDISVKYQRLFEQRLTRATRATRALPDDGGLD